VWLRHLFAVGVEQTRGAMVTGCESWRVSLGRAPVVGEGKGPVCLRVGWSFVVGGVMWWSHTLFGRARTHVCALTSVSGCVVWDFARESGVGSASWFGVGVRVNSGGISSCCGMPRGEPTCGRFWARVR
jgi:hypothetical protein